VDPHPDARPEGLNVTSAAMPGPEPVPAAAPAPEAEPLTAPEVEPTTGPEPATAAAAAPPVSPAPAPEPGPASAPPPASEPAPAPARVSWAERGAVSSADPVELEAALEAVRLARAGLVDETTRLEATLRDAVDIKAKVRRSPGKAAAIAGGAAFVALGGPRRVLRRTRRAVFGVPDPLPSSLLPDQVERAVRALGDDGSKVRGALEREFAGYLSSTRKRDRNGLRLALLATLGPVVRQAGVEGVKRLFATESGRVNELAERLRRARGGTGTG
jgi:hypothetical protein